MQESAGASMDQTDFFTRSEMTGAGALWPPLEPSTLVPARLRARVENPHMWTHFHRAL